MGNKMKIAAYCRVSTDKDDQLNSFSNQIQFFQDYIKKHDGWEIAEIYTDEGVSGTSTKKRAGFNRMIHDACCGKIDLILTKEISRFARNTLDSIQYTRQLKELGVGVLFMNDNINTLDNDGEVRLTIMSSLAQEESRKTSERVKWGQKKRMEQGVVFGRDLLGYSVRNGHLFIKDQEAEIVKLIYHKYINEGKSTHKIAKELADSGFQPKMGDTWSNTIILRVLRNEKYVGDLLQKKTYTPDYLTHIKKTNRGNEQTIYIKNHHESIIDRETWDRVQDELIRRSPGKGEKSKYSSRYWCSGKLFCGECGQRFVSLTKKLVCGITYKAWRCINNARHGNRHQDVNGNILGCSSGSINEKTVLFCAGYALRMLSLDKDSIVAELAKDLKMIVSSGTAPTGPLKLQTRIDRLTQKKVEAIDLVLDKIMSGEDLECLIKNYDLEIESLRSRIAQAENTNLIYKKQLDDTHEILACIRGMLEFDICNTGLFKDMIDKMIVYAENTVDVHIKYLPVKVRLHYRTEGRLDRFSIRIESAQRLE